MSVPPVICVYSKVGKRQSTNYAIVQDTTKQGQRASRSIMRRRVKRTRYNEIGQDPYIASVEAFAPNAHFRGHVEFRLFLLRTLTGEGLGPMLIDTTVHDSSVPVYRFYEHEGRDWKDIYIARVLVHQHAFVRYEDVEKI